jgi:hypothetical protein
MSLVGTQFGRVSFLVPIALALIACRATSQPQPLAPRYLITESPIDVGLGIGLCVAVSPADQRGIWWWGPGATGCDSRSTGPGLFQAYEGTVSHPIPPGLIVVDFRLGTHSAARSFIDVRLVIEGEQMRAIESGARVSLLRRASLDVPEGAVRGR